MSEIKFGNNEFYIEESGEVIARIQFIPSGTDVSGRDLIIVNHTVVYPGHNGKGLGKKLVDRLAEYARNEKKYIIPVCPYAKNVLESSVKYKDVMAN
ncbi:GNAT family N-acetyltransferase [Niallia sp. Krafla_26]|uniref:GNAT family N-acetyltransferase n=1 Tax=Niallia sp. Krafla_26 TaxID=3064703 RepID=UPI003D17168F